jgi:hypothetical protein
MITIRLIDIQRPISNQISATLFNFLDTTIGLKYPPLNKEQGKSTHQLISFFYVVIYNQGSELITHITIISAKICIE